MRCLTVFALFMWLLVVSLSSDYWLGLSPRETLIALVDVEVYLGIPSCVTRWVPRGSCGLILGSTGRGRPLPVLPRMGRPLPVLPRIRPRLPHGTQRAPHDEICQASNRWIGKRLVAT